MTILNFKDFMKNIRFESRKNILNLEIQKDILIEVL